MVLCRFRATVLCFSPTRVDLVTAVVLEALALKATEAAE